MPVRNHTPKTYPRTFRLTDDAIAAMDRVCAEHHVTRNDVVLGLLSFMAVLKDKKAESLVIGRAPAAFREDAMKHLIDALRR